MGGLELRNVDANYLFERSHRFAGIQPNSGFGDYSRLSCGVGDTQLGRISTCRHVGATVARAGLPLTSLMQADFVLFLFSSITSLRENRQIRWWPETLLYYRDYTPPFEIFARAESLRYLQKICPLIAVKSKAELGEAFKLFENRELRLPHWDVYHSISLETATNFEKLASKP